MGKLLRFFDPYIGLMILVAVITAVLPAHGQGAVIAKYAR